MRAWALLVVAACSFRHGETSLGDGSAAPIPDGPPADARSDWWNSAWQWRIPITITAGAALPMTYQIPLPYPVGAAPCTANRDDIRIVYGTTELARVIDEVGPPQWTWFRLAAPLAAGATSTGEYWLYCGNPSPPAAPADPAQVFDFYDGFDTAIGTAWNKTNVASVSGGLLVCGGTTTTQDSGVVSKTTYGAKHAVDFVAIASSTTASVFWAGFQNGTMDVPPYMHWYADTGNEILPDYQGTSAGMFWLGTPVALDLSPHIYSYENYADSSMYRHDDVPYAMHAYDVLPPATESIRLWDAAGKPTVSYDWVRIRQAIKPNPTVMTGPPEMY